jgi:hypothetical protein
MSKYRAFVVCILSGVFCCTISVVVLGVDCDYVGVACPGWGASSPKIPGFCCVQQEPGAVPCSEGQFMTAEQGGGGCGKLKEIQGGNCSSTGDDPCGVNEAVLGCSSGACSG